MGKGTEPPVCKSCGKPHWGTCLDHDAGGSLSRRVASVGSLAPGSKSAILAQVLGLPIIEGIATEKVAKESEGRQLSVSTSAASGIDRRDSARSVRPTSDKSTAARKDVRSQYGSEAPAQPSGNKDPIGQREHGAGSGNQAPPVDTGFDKTAYQRDYMRRRRAEKKAGMKG